VSCSTCTLPPCPAVPCFPFALPAVNDFIWDGTSTVPSTCGQQVACSQQDAAPAGQYVARMCATPGNVTRDDGGPVTTCTATGPTECTDVPFDFPHPSPVIGTLP
jgi:hypothetical protein